MGLSKPFDRLKFNFNITYVWERYAHVMEHSALAITHNICSKESTYKLQRSIYNWRYNLEGWNVLSILMLHRRNKLSNNSIADSVIKFYKI